MPPAEAALGSLRLSITKTAPGRAFLDALALRVAAVLEHADMVEVLARRDVAHRVGRPDQAGRARIEGLDPGYELVARKPRLNRTVVQRCRGDRGELVPGRRR